MNVSIKYILLLFLILFVGIQLSVFSFSEEISNLQAEKNKLPVSFQWSHQCNSPDRHRTFLAGEGVYGFITISGFPLKQNSNELGIVVSIYDEKEEKIIHTVPTISIGIDSLYVNPNVLKGSAFKIWTFYMVLPELSILSEGNYVLKLTIQDEISGLPGEDKLYFAIVSPNTLKLINVNLGVIATNTLSQDKINQEKNFSDLQPPVFAIPIGHRIPAIRFQVNGLEVNKDNDIDVCVKLTQYSEKGVEVWNYEKSYTGKDFIKDKPFPGLLLLPKLCPGYGRVKIEVEDRNSKKWDSIELPYAVINSIDMLNQYNYPKNLQPKVKK
ncbi:MAG: hypothetical protein LBE12_08945 [Planctomycetaceae bacterium]|jgi:hypothetical protein|nr:hypothetical protein [Planctomycetaceae bacterium]